VERFVVHLEETDCFALVASSALERAPNRTLLRLRGASRLLQSDKSPEYVRQQLGHSSLTLTINTYGSWLPMSDVAAVDALDDVIDDKTVIPR
jgi:integrase